MAALKSDIADHTGTGSGTGGDDFLIQEFKNNVVDSNYTVLFAETPSGVGLGMMVIAWVSPTSVRPCPATSPISPPGLTRSLCAPSHPSTPSGRIRLGADVEPLAKGLISGADSHVLAPSVRHASWQSYWQSLRVAAASRGRGVAALLFRLSARLAAERQGPQSISRWGIVSSNSLMIDWSAKLRLRGPVHSRPRCAEPLVRYVTLTPCSP